jgi:hypothetical protein
MRRSLFLALLALSLWLPPAPLAAAEISAQGVLVPRDVYVGDEALLTVDFTPPFPLLGKEGTELLRPGERLAIPPAPTVAPAEPGAPALPYTIRGGELSRDAAAPGATYHLALRFTPWEPGQLTFPPFDLRRLVPADLDAEATAADPDALVLRIAPVTIPSLSEKLGETRLRPARPPAVVPGTTYLLLGGIAALVLLVSLMVAALVKGEALRRRIAGRLGSLVFSRAGRRALRSFAALGKKAAAMNARDFAALVEHNLRTYLEKRFCRPFTAMTAPELEPEFSALFGLAADGFLDEQTARLHRIFLRCDFLRYSGSGANVGIDFSPAERRELIAEAAALITAFEKGPPLPHSKNGRFNGKIGKSLMPFILDFTENMSDSTDTDCSDPCLWAAFVPGGS